MLHNLQASEYEFNEVMISHCCHVYENRSTFIPHKNISTNNDTFKCKLCGKVIDLSRQITYDSLKESYEMVLSVLNSVRVLKIESALFLRFLDLVPYNKDIQELNSLALVQHSVRNNVLPLYHYIKKNTNDINFNFTRAEELEKACELVDNVFDVIKFSFYTTVVDEGTKRVIESAINNLSDNTGVVSDLIRASDFISEYVLSVFEKISI